MQKKKEHKHQAVKRNQPETAKIAHAESWKYSVALVVILVLSFIIYLPVLHNGFVWDDEAYIQKNPLLYTFNLKEIFSRNVMGNYHPLTILALATEYHFFGLNETGYHTINLLLHLLNVILVFYAVFLLSDKVVVALVASLLFGIHPMHVESVAWASELKDLLYTFFFLASYIFYLKYLRGFKKKYYVFALLLFSVSLLSKAMAASLPVVLILTDYFKGRKINIKTLLEKLPFFLLALVLGVIAVFAQKSSDAMQNIVFFTFPQRIVFACYGFITYLLKLLLPLHLSALYPYPVKNGDGIPVLYYVYVLFFSGLVAYVFYSLRSSKKIIFCIGFFAATVFLVLQLLPIGGAIMADRYSYIPSIGIFSLAGEGFILLWNKKQNSIAIILLIVFTVFFSVTTYSRCGVWKNGMTLWTNVISEYQTSSLSYYNRGVVFMNDKKYSEALDDYSKAIELKPNYTDAYINKGNILRDIGRNEEALKDFNKAIELKPAYSVSYYNRGIVFMNEGKYNQALDDYSKAIELDAKYAKAYNNRGAVYMNEKKYDEALNDYRKGIELNPTYAGVFNNLSNKNEKKYNEASDEYKNAIELNATYAEAYINRGNNYKDEKEYDRALDDYSKALEVKPNCAEAYYNRGIVFYDEKRYEEAISAYSKAIELNADYVESYFNRGLAEYYSGKKDAACKDLNHAGSLGFPPAANAISQFCN